MVERVRRLDGVKDGLIENPERCTFDPAVLQCKDADGAACLTPAQVETARLIYCGAMNPKTKREIAGLAPGSELGWTDLGLDRLGSRDRARSVPLSRVRRSELGRSSSSTSSPTSCAPRTSDGDTINALDPNLKPFFDRGGKLIQYHGWSDPQISPGNSTQYYARVLEALGGAGKVHGSYRLFMAPGMGHCGGGEGPNTFDMVSALEQWVEHGQARPIRSSRHIRPTASSIGRGRSVRIRRSRSTRDREARTRPRTLSAARRAVQPSAALPIRRACSHGNERAVADPDSPWGRSPCARSGRVERQSLSALGIGREVVFQDWHDRRDAS